MESSMDSTTTIAYAAIYLLWGGAYLAIRCLMQEFPPLWAAGTRYALATICLVVLLAFRGLPLPTLRQFINAAWTGVVLLAMAYGSLFWAAKDLPAWLVAVLMSTTFLWTYIGETLVFRVYPFRIRILPPLLNGLIAVPFLVKLAEEVREAEVRSRQCSQFSSVPFVGLSVLSQRSAFACPLIRFRQPRSNWARPLSFF